jgi:hypothetical protein
MKQQTTAIPPVFIEKEHNAFINTGLIQDSTLFPQNQGLFSKLTKEDQDIIR